MLVLHLMLVCSVFLRFLGYQGRCILVELRVLSTLHLDLEVAEFLGIDVHLVAVLFLDQVRE